MINSKKDPPQVRPVAKLTTAVQQLNIMSVWWPNLHTTAQHHVRMVSKLTTAQHHFRVTAILTTAHMIAKLTTAHYYVSVVA
jgi:hypothetical protein